MDHAADAPAPHPVPTAGAGTLFVVATPIGNMEDLTERARRVLSSVHLIASEDTRRTGRLLQLAGVHGPRMASFFEGNETARVPELVSVLRDGKDVAVVTDAGTPGVSDPGYRLVAACVAAEIPVDVVPGPSAVLAALVLSGFPTDRFVFEGFLPRSGKARRARLDALAVEPRTVVLFESPRRVASTLGDLLEAGPDRRVCVARELTKLHQEVLRGTVAEVSELVRTRAPKGEVTLVLEGVPRPERPIDDASRRVAVDIAAELVSAGMAKRDAARVARDRTGVPARDVYQGLLSGGR